MGGSTQRVVAIATSVEGLDTSVEICSIDKLSATVSDLPIANADCVVIDATDDSDRALELLQAIQHLDPALPVVLTTATPDGSLASTATRHGVTEYVPRTDPTSEQTVTLSDRVQAILADHTSPPLSSVDEPRQEGDEVTTTPSETGAGPPTSNDVRATRETVLHRLHNVMTETGTSFEAKLERLLSIGQSVLGVDYGALSTIDADHDRYEIEAVSGVDDRIETGTNLSLASTYCKDVVGTGESLSFASVTDDRSELANRAVYEQFGISCYLGTPVVVDGEEYGTLCFIAREERPRQFDRWETTVVELIANWIGHELEHQQRREALEQARSSLEDTLERIDDGFFALDTEWKFTYVNDRAAALIDPDDQGLIGEVIWDVFPEAVGSTFEQAYRRAMDEQTATTFEEYFPPLERWFDVHVYPSPNGISVYFQDITDKRRRDETERALHETTQWLFAAETADTVAAIVADAAVDIFGFDMATVRLHDPDRDQLEVAALAKDGIESVADPPAIDTTTGPIGDAFERGEPVVFDDLSTPVGHDYGPLSRGIAIPLGSAGVLSGGSVEPTTIDQSDINLLELLATSAVAALERASRREELLRYEQVLEAVEGLVYALDTDGQFTLVTEPLADRLGYERATLRGKHVSAVLDEDDMAKGQRCIQTLLDEPERTSACFEATCLTADGGGFPVEIELSVLTTNGTFSGTVGTVRDITERKEREQYLQVLTRVLRHNLRNDLTVVEGYAELLAEDLDDPSLTPVAEQLCAAAADLARTSTKARHIEQILSRGDVDCRPIDLLSVLEDCIAEVSETAAAGADISINTGIDESWVRADDELRTAIVNLLENAVRHAGPEPTVVVTVRHTADCVRLSITDDGPGIPQSEVDVVTGKTPISQLTHSNGLGLWLVRWIVSAYGGEVEFDDSERGGSAVTLVLEPAEQSAATDAR